jgi:dTDP-4-amino-4,6-dideoxygalactose transaminase
MDSMMSNASEIYRQLRTISEHGLEAAADSPGAYARLQEFHDLMAFIEVEVPRVIDRFLEERAALANEASA